jgi:hypothetical protein
MTRKTLGYLIAPVMAITGFRFSKHYRWGTNGFYRTVYAMVDTVGANYHADGIRPTPIVLIPVE